MNPPDRPRHRHVDHLRIVHEPHAGLPAPGLVQDRAQDDHLLLPALELVDGVCLDLIEQIGSLVGLESVWRGDADVGVGNARAVIPDHLLGDGVQLALVRAPSSSVLAHVVALGRATHDHRPLGAAARVRDELAVVELLVAEPDDGRVAPVVLTQQRARQAVAVQLVQRGEQVVLSNVIGRAGRGEVGPGIERDRLELSLIAHHHEVAATRQRQPRRQ